MHWVGLAVGMVLFGSVSSFGAAAEGAALVSCERIWDEAPHNAFTSLVRFEGRWYCVFREGQAHVSPDGALRVLVSADGDSWRSAARITHPKADLRDAQICVTPDGRLMLTGAGAWHDKGPGHHHQTFAYFSEDGKTWSDGAAIGEPDFWLWRVTWREDTAYGVGYATGEGPRSARLYRSGDGLDFKVHVRELHTEEYPNESSLVFREDGAALCLLRRGGTGLLGHAAAPYQDWTWKDLGVKIGGPNMIEVPGGRLVAAVRLYDEPVRTALCWVDPEAGALTEFLALPSGGDTSYAGLVWHEDLLWVSYYSSHEGKTSIYLARVRLP